MRRRQPTFSVILTALVTLAGCASNGTTASTTARLSADTLVPSTTAAPATTAAPTTTVAPLTHLRGTAYTFNTPTPIIGAAIKTVEYPDVSATTAADGSYQLDVPAGSKVTPYIEATGHHTIYLQTFTLDAAHEGATLDGVNFQTPTDAIYEALKGLIGGFVGRDPFEGGCVIVTTVGDSKLVGMTFDQFINFHPHGVSGATANIDPPSAKPIYFNDNVLPDQAQLATSGDGGVLWANVPPGDYTLTATKPGTNFATVHVTCKQDWVINANPIWGLHAIP